MSERVHITFHADAYTDHHPYMSPHIVTLPQLQEMSLSTFSKPARAEVPLPHILKSLHLPKLMSLCVQPMPERMISGLILPVAVTPFGERLPNLAELPELQVNMTTLSGELTFRSPSQAVTKR
jgi:hypothetical protein